MNEGLQNLIRKAEQGDVEAMCMVGDCYNRGLYTAKNDEQSHYWYQMAADKGHTKAEFTVGLDYLNGIGVKKNNRMAVQYIKRAADKGLSDAQYILGRLYKIGKAGLLLKEQRAVFYLKKAAEQGHAAAQVALGDCFILGEGVPENQDKGLFWLTCAYLHGKKNPEESRQAQDRLNHLITSGNSNVRKKIDSYIEKIKTQYPLYY